MAYAVRIYADLVWIPDGGGTALLGQSQSNEPGFGSALNPGAVPVAQTLRLQVMELVPGGDAPSQANWNTALSSAATDLGTLMGTAGAFSGGTQTPYQITQGWSTGSP